MKTELTLKLNELCNDAVDKEYVINMQGKNLQKTNKSLMENDIDNISVKSILGGSHCKSIGVTHFLEIKAKLFLS